MTLDESARLYLVDYYLLEQAREGANQFLEHIAESLQEAVKEELSKREDDLVSWGSWMKKGGGVVEFWVEEQGVSISPEMDAVKYTVAYRDAMETQRLTDTTKCRIYGSTPKSQAAQERTLKGMAATFKLPDPYRNEEYDLISSPAEEVVADLTRELVARMDEYAEIVRSASQIPEPREN